MIINKTASIIAVAILFLFATGCQKEYSLDNGTSPGNSGGSALYQFAGSPGNCTTPLIAGLYDAGTVLDSSNKIILSVNVAAIGTYQVSTGTVNGIQFTVSDSFRTTGIQSITLKGSGTPLTAGSYNFSLGSASCSFTITFTGTVPPPVVPGTGNCKDCIYQPICVGSKYTYADSTMGIESLRNLEFVSTTDTTIDGKTYQKVVHADGAVAFYNCTNGESTSIGYMVTSVNGNVLDKIKLLFLKANAPVNSTWTENMTNPLGQVVSQKFIIEEKGISRKVGTFNFNDVIVVRLETGIDFPPIGFIVASVTRYYYAKGVGQVEAISIDSTTGTAIFHSVIKSYYIP